MLAGWRVLLAEIGRKQDAAGRALSFFRFALAPPEVPRISFESYRGALATAHWRKWKVRRHPCGAFRIPVVRILGTGRTPSRGNQVQEPELILLAL